MPEPTPFVAKPAGMSPTMKMIMLGLYTLVIIAIAIGASYFVFKGTQPSAQDSAQTPTPTPTPTPETPLVAQPVPVSVYFYTGPFTQADSTPGTLTLVEASRGAVSDDIDLHHFALDQIVIGPTATEMAAGMRTSFGFTGDSTCGTGDFTLTRSGTLLKVALCRDLDISNQSPAAGGAYAGITLTQQSNAREQIKKTLKFGGITTVEVRDKNGQCYAPDVQDTDCTPT